MNTEGCASKGGMNKRARVVTLMSVLSVAGLNLIACSEPPSAGSRASQQQSEVTGENAAEDGEEPADQSSTPRSATVQGDGGAAPGELACHTLEKDACTACCNIAFPQMDLALKQSFAQCLCQSECSSQCGSNFCSGQPATEACSTCVNTSKICAPATMTVCQASAECVAYSACLDSCK